MFDHERLEVYQLELQFLSWVTDLLDEVRESKSPRVREVSDQLDRASLSSLLNTAEGNAKRYPQLRFRYFGDARGSAIECAACLDALVAKRLSTAMRVHKGKEMLVRIVQMLTKLAPEPANHVRELRTKYGGTADYDYDYEYDYEVRGDGVEQ